MGTPGFSRKIIHLIIQQNTGTFSATIPVPKVVFGYMGHRHSVPDIYPATEVGGLVAFIRGELARVASGWKVCGA